jgi:hypothetical protein
MDAKLLKSIALFIILAFFAGCSSMKEVPSAWNDNKINIDGNSDDWASDFYYFEDAKAIVGARNDNEYLYLCFIVNDETTINKVMSAGMTLWLNNKGNKNETVGIQYPIGMPMGKGGGAPNGMPNSGGRQGRNGMTNSGETQEGGGMPSENSGDKDKRKKGFVMDKNSTMLQELKLKTDDGENVITMTLVDAKKKNKIQVSLENTGDILTIEIAIPLKSELIDLDVRKIEDQAIGIGFVTTKMERPSGSMGGGGGMPGGGGGMPGGGGSMQSMDEQLELWFEYKPAKK